MIRILAYARCTKRLPRKRRVVVALAVPAADPAKAGKRVALHGEPVPDAPEPVDHEATAAHFRAIVTALLRK
jgi:hypothetical protein